MSSNHSSIPVPPQRVPSVTFAPFPDLLTRSRSSSHPNEPARDDKPHDSRKHSHSLSSDPRNHPLDTKRNHSFSSVKSDTKRNHSLSVSSVSSLDSDFPDLHYPASRGKIALMDDVDLEKQLILTAGGKREHVTAFLCKLLFLMLIVVASAVLIFYAL